MGSLSRTKPSGCGRRNSVAPSPTRSDAGSRSKPLKRQALPAYGNELILVVKGTSLASTITVLEITGNAKRLMS